MVRKRQWRHSGWVMILTRRILPALIFAATVVGSVLVYAQPPQDPDWPCAQIFVPEVSAAVVWDGPPLEAKGWDSQADERLNGLARRLSARRTPLAEAETLIQRFVESTPEAGRNERLTHLFARTLHTLNGERAQLQRGIKRFARGQQERAQRIQETLNELVSKDSREGGVSGAGEAAELRERLTWQRRMFEERERQVSYLCEQPRVIEERIGALARTLSTHLR